MKKNMLSKIYKMMIGSVCILLLFNIAYSVTLERSSADEKCKTVLHTKFKTELDPSVVSVKISYDEARTSAMDVENSIIAKRHMSNAVLLETQDGPFSSEQQNKQTLEKNNAFGKTYWIVKTDWSEFHVDSDTGDVLYISYEGPRCYDEKITDAEAASILTGYRSLFYIPEGKETIEKYVQYKATTEFEDGTEQTKNIEKYRLHIQGHYGDIPTEDYFQIAIDDYGNFDHFVYRFYMIIDEDTPTNPEITGKEATSIASDFIGENREIKETSLEIRAASYSSCYPKPTYPDDKTGYLTWVVNFSDGRQVLVDAINGQVIG